VPARGADHRGGDADEADGEPDDGRGHAARLLPRLLRHRVRRVGADRVHPVPEVGARRGDQPLAPRGRLRRRGARQAGPGAGVPRGGVLRRHPRAGVGGAGHHDRRAPVPDPAGAQGLAVVVAHGARRRVATRQLHRGPPHPDVRRQGVHGAGAGGAVRRPHAGLLPLQGVRRPPLQLPQPGREAGAVRPQHEPVLRQGAAGRVQGLPQGPHHRRVQRHHDSRQVRQHVLRQPGARPRTAQHRRGAVDGPPHQAPGAALRVQPHCLLHRLRPRHGEAQLVRRQDRRRRRGQAALRRVQQRPRRWRRHAYGYAHAQDVTLRALQVQRRRPHACLSADRSTAELCGTMTPAAPIVLYGGHDGVKKNICGDVICFLLDQVIYF
jgi:hypothetical protein